VALPASKGGSGGMTQSPSASYAPQIWGRARGGARQRQVAVPEQFGLEPGPALFVTNLLCFAKRRLRAKVPTGRLEFDEKKCAIF